MAELVTGWRRIGGVLAALVLAVTAFGSVSSATICLDDLVGAASAVDASGQADTDAGSVDPAPCDDQACPCGHCKGHQTATGTPAIVAGIPDLTPKRTRYVFVVSPPPTLHPVSGLMRPPRA